MIGDNIQVIVLGMAGSQVRLGIAAPQEISVHRQEVYQRIHAEGNVNLPARLAK